MRNKIFLVLILLAAFSLRLYRLNEYPVLNADEAAIGYNAYSLIETGRDEHGNPWPIHFQSFNDYKPGLYFYLVLPFVQLIGLNEWAVRIPSALLGAGTVYIIYLLVMGLGELGNLEEKDAKATALVSALFLSISPWHLHFSRGGWEVNVATFFITLGVLLFLKSLKSSRYYILSFLSFVTSLYTYHSARVIVPALLLGLFVIFRKRLFADLKKVVVAAVISAIVLIPLGIDFSKGVVISRASGVSIFADQGTIERINEQRGEHGFLQGVVPRLMHNKLINYSLAFFNNWSKHFHGEFLFLSGDEIQRNRVPETGQMYMFDFLLVSLGLIVLIRQFQKANKGWLFLLWWLVVAPSAAALTFQSPHALRAQNMVIPLVILSAYGLVNIVGYLKRSGGYGGIVILALVLIWSVTRYLMMYWLHMSKEYPFSSQYGLKELINYVKENNYDYEKVIVTNEYDQPYIMFLFYLHYPPEKFQKNHVLTGQDRYGFSTVDRFEKFEFRQIDFDVDREKYPNSLIVGTDKEIPSEVNIVKDIYGSNGYRYFRIAAN